MYYNSATRSNSKQFTQYQPISYTTSNQKKMVVETTPTKNLVFRQQHNRRPEYSPYTRTPTQQKTEQVQRVLKQPPKTGTHKQYFQKPEIRFIKPISVNSKAKNDHFALSEQSTSAHFSQISYKQQPVSLDWNYIRRKTDTNIFTNFNFGCYMEQPRRVSCFCSCSTPCKWAERWSNWAKMPKQTMYNQIKQGPVLRQIEEQIKKDSTRTYNGSIVTQFSYLRMLKQVLQTYSKYDQAVGYVQGMNMIVSAILHHVKNPEQTFWILVDIMQRREMKEVYLNDFEKLRVHTQHINKLVQYKINDLYLHLIQNGIQLQMITTGWFLSMMCNIIPLQNAHLMIDMFITEGFQGFYKVILTYLLYLKEEIMLKDDPSDILSRFSSTYKQEDVDWEEILQSSVNFRLNWE